MPHRIVIDEAHYFLRGDPHQLDPELHGYTIVTCFASRLPQIVLSAAEVVLATCESNPAEIDALRRRCTQCATVEPWQWHARIGHLPIGQAVALPITEEAHGQLTQFTVGRRLTPHVRHREKYVDVPVSEQRAFVFARTDGQLDRRTKTLREFVIAAEASSTAALGGYLRRNDFSRWIRDVFGDHALAAELREQEERFKAGVDDDVIPEMVNAIRARYDLSDDEVAESFGLAAAAPPAVVAGVTAAA